MMKVLVPLLAVVTVFAVGFVLFELHAPLSPAASPAAAPPSPSPSLPAPPRAVPAPPVATAPGPLAAAPPAAAPSPSAPAGTPPSENPPPAADPLDVVVRGKTRREWHAYYAERQQQIVADIQRYQSVIDRAIAGEEPDPRELGEAHDKVRELNARLKEDLEALQQIDATP